MEGYANRSGKSSVTGYQIGDDYIWVQFEKGDIYEYTYTSAGVSNIEAMKSYARSGGGLGSFIQRDVRTSYSRKL